MKSVIRTKNGKKYRKLKDNEIIEKGAMHSWCGYGLTPITNYDEGTIGSTPANFSASRAFFNPIIKERR
jgi:hypothetical protein